MMTMKRLLALLAAGAMCLSLYACKDSTGGESDAPGSSADVSAALDTSPEPSPEIEVDLSQNMYEFSSGLKDTDAALTVNGKAVSNQYFLYWLASYCYYADYYSFMSGQTADFADEEVRSGLLEEIEDMVAYHAVLWELCQAEGVTVTQEQQTELQGQIEDQQGLEAVLRDLGVDEETFYRIAENNYLFTNYAEKVMGEPAQADLEQYVADQKIYRVKHILVKTIDDSGQPLEDSVIAEKKAQAEDLLSQLQDLGADELEAKFDELMNEHSEDGRDEDGALAAPDGYTAFPGEMVSEFEEASLALEVGELSGIVESTYGYHIILRLSVDASQYEEDWYTDGANEAIGKAVDEADIVMADAMAALDVKSFYDRYMAYYSELQESLDPSEPVETSGPEPVPEG